MTWSDAVSAFLSGSDLSTSTRAAYGRALKQFGEWYVKRYDDAPHPTLLTEEETWRWRDYLRDDLGRSAATVNQYLSALRRLAAFHDNTLEIAGVRKVEQPIETLTDHELGRLIRGARQMSRSAWIAARHVAVLSLMARAGLRLSEVCALDRDDLVIRERSGHVLVRQGKGDKDRRVPLSKRARRELSKYLEKDRPAPAEGGNPLFVSQDGLRLKPRSVQAMVRRAGRHAMLQITVHPHLLRHTFATRFLRESGNVAVLSKLLGHANIATTSRYLHPTAIEMQAQVEEL
jgi:site-specific recombinase XerD